jgi:chemotaxis protein methyltransferase CheR
MNAENTALVELNTSDFNNIRSLVHENTGIALSPSKRELVKRRFSPRLRALGLDSFGAYVNYLRNNFDREGNHFCNAITTNLTSFFRENHHFELLRNEVLPQLLKTKRQNDRIRIWSAGCSTGQEAYCLAITLLKSISDIQRRDVKILATDLDENCLATARKGAYPDKEFEAVNADILKNYFTPEIVGAGYKAKNCYTASNKLKELIRFNKLNLMEPWPMKGRFDVIFCRNVFIYFDKDTQLELLRGFAALQPPGSYLCIGHSEIIPNPAQLGYQLVGKTAYRKKG